MKDLFGNISSVHADFTVFQDEAGCQDSNYFYHGFMFVNNNFGREILNKVIEIKSEKSKDSEITFKEIKKDDYRVRIATEWIKLAVKLLQEGKIRFYVLGINKNHLKNFWDNTWSFDKNIYLRFFEIGLNSSVGWFSNDPKLDKPLQVTHIYYEYGNYNDERKNKIHWLNALAGYKDSCPIYSNPKKQKEVDEKLYKLSNLIQLTDVLLGATKYSFIKMNENYTGRKKCVGEFIEIVERFNNKQRAYRTKSSFYKRYALQFFPTKSNITRAEFIDNDFESIRKRGVFYCDRPTYRQQLGQGRNFKLF